MVMLLLVLDQLVVLVLGEINCGVVSGDRFEHTFRSVV